MKISEKIYQLRSKAGLSQEQFSDLFGVTRQSVQKWENGTSVPELDKVVRIAKYFDISLDALLLDRSKRMEEEQTKQVAPNYAGALNGNTYDLPTEYSQSVDEGLDIEQYKDVFASVSRLPNGKIKTMLGDALFEAVLNAKQRPDYPYTEPSDLAEIQSLRKPHPVPDKKISRQESETKLSGAWMGRICGCLLGKTVEGISTDELHPFLKETGNWPMHRYIFRSDLTDEICAKYSYGFINRPYADTADGMPIDDDTNYTVLAQWIVEKYGRDFTSNDVAQAWLACQPKNAYCTAEQVAFCNFVSGFEPPQSALYKNPCREMIGAQIRGDYFGYINPGDPETAAAMAFRDASISHVKNGIYGEMFAAAMLACAAVTDSIEEILLGGLAQIPHTSRLYEAIMEVLNDYNKHLPQEACFAKIHEKFDEHNGYAWVHTISNAMIVTASLLYGKKDYGKSICMAVETGFDTDCNGATVGSVLGMVLGAEGIDPVWTEPIRDTLHTSILPVGTVRVSDCVKKTLQHINQ